MEKRKPFGDLTNLSEAFFSSLNVKPRPESSPLAEPRGKKKLGSNLKVSDEKKDDFTVTKPRKPEPDQIVAKTDVNSSEKVDQEQQEESPNLGVSSLESSDLEMTEVSPVKGRQRTRPADLILTQQTSSLHSLEMEEVELSGWTSPSLHSQDSQNDFFVLRSAQVYSVVSSPLYNLAPGLQVMSPVTPPTAFHPGSVPALLSLSPCLSSPPSQDKALFATLVAPGFVRLCLSHGVSLDISNDLSLRITNPMMESSIAVCGLSQRAAIIHPTGRALVYSPRLEVQVKDEVSIKTAKLFPRARLSFTADNYALVYSLDSAGPRSTTDVFHDLLADNIVDTMFHESCLAQHSSMAVSREQMYESQYWRTPEDVNCWIFGPIFIQQFSDGMVMVEIKGEGGSRLRLRTSPGNGRLRFESNFVQVTASLGEQSHFYVKSGTRNIHYNAVNNVFKLRCASHQVGFDEEGTLRIY